MILFKHSINLMISWALFKDELVTTTLHYKLHTSHDAMNQTRIVVIVEIYKKNKHNSGPKSETMASVVVF
jgi:hypothetical protein